MDNNAYEIVQKDGFIFSVLELIPYLRPNRISFPKGTRHLIVNEQDQTFWSKKLQEATKRNVKVGISWRSGLLSQARNHHYLFIEEMKPLFEVKNVSFVNLQYNVADSESSFLTNYLGQRFLNFSELDLKNDFDGSNALMSNLDLVISPCTTTAEAAAACGVKTWMFSNSPLNNYRRQSATDCHDIWQPTLEIIRPKKFGDKEGLVNELALRLSQFYNEFTN